MSSRKQIERTLVDNIFQTMGIIISKSQIASQQSCSYDFKTCLPADKIGLDKYVILHLSSV